MPAGICSTCRPMVIATPPQLSGLFGLRPPPDLPLHVIAPASLHKGKWRVAAIPADSKFLLDTKACTWPGA